MLSLNLQDVSWLWVADAVLKATLLLVGAALGSVLLRRGSAASRHFLWTLALLGALAMPVLSTALPRWQLPLVTLASGGTDRDWAAADFSAPLRAPAQMAASTESTGRASVAPPAAAAPSLPTSVLRTSTAAANISWQAWLLLAWLAGTLLVLARLTLGVVAVHWLARRTERADGARWFALASELAAAVGVSSRVRFLRSARATMPMACGILRPSIVMPADADAWPAERLRIVLLHELAHVKRRDCLTHVLAQLTCALYWFNPLAWLAARRVRTERERACDDLVLAAGTDGPDYADQLLEIARVMRAGRFPGVLAGASLAMAHRSQLEGRLMAILDPKVPRAGVTRVRAAAITMLVAGALLPLASVQPWAYTEEKNSGRVTVRTDVTAPDDAVATREPQQAAPSPAPVPPPAPPRPSAAPLPGQDVVQGMIQGTTQGVIQGVVQGMSQGAVQGIAQGAVQGIAAALPMIDFRVDVDRWQTEAGAQFSGRARDKADPRTIAALTAALKDTDKDVRETALQALVQLRDPSVYEPLIEALRDEAADVRQQAAFGLGQLRDRRAVPALTAALKDPAADVRQQAVFALGQLRDAAAVEAIAAAVRDANADVRQQAVFALGQIRDRRAVEPLISALKDSAPDVRQQAAFALGQIRERVAVEALVIALKDTHADVRQQAAFALGQLRDPRAIDGLTAALKDASADVRQQAAFALGQIAR